MTAATRSPYVLGAVALGVVTLAFGAFSPDWLPLSPRLHGYLFLVFAAAAILVVGGLAMIPRRMAAGGGFSLFLLFAAGMLIVEAPTILTKPASWGGWQAAAESVAMAMGGLIASAPLWRARAALVVRIGRWAFGLCLLVFGISHFVFAGYTAALVPAWAPPSRLFWVYVTGLAQICAGLGLLSGVRARLAAVLLTVMYVIFGLFVHLPAAVAHPASQDVWAENAINLILIGVAWIVAASLPRTRMRG